jgi:hypothetical protein
MTPRLDRFIIALVFALLAAGTTLVIASAQSGTVLSVQPSTAYTSKVQSATSSNCATCHTEFQEKWQMGAHGQAGEDPVFQQEWDRQGKPGACLVCHTTGYDPATATYKESGVACESCHGPVPDNHPKTPMPVVRSTELCSRCHSDTRFDVQAWSGSTHYQRGLECTTCHDPHSASIKTVPAPREGEKTDPVSQLCITCHQESSMDFDNTAHAQKNIACVDCHVTESTDVENAPHKIPDHSFEASLASCNTCHAQQMHSDAEAVNTKEATVPIAAEPSPEIQRASILPEPDAVSPVGFALVAALIGLAGGMVLAPWLERWYRRVKQEKGEEQDGQ